MSHDTKRPTGTVRKVRSYRGQRRWRERATRTLRLCGEQRKLIPPAVSPTFLPLILPAAPGGELPGRIVGAGCVVASAGVRREGCELSTGEDFLTRFHFFKRALLSRQGKGRRRQGRDEVRGSRQNRGRRHTSGVLRQEVLREETVERKEEPIMSEQPKIMIRTRAPRADKGHPWWTPRDLAVLAWIAEQYGVRRDQLAVLLAREGVVATQTPGRVAESTVKDWVQRWRRAGIVGSTLVFAGQPSWVWVTRLGCEHLELDYRLWEPRARGLPHLYAVNEARLLVEARYPEAEWHSERARRHGQPFVAGQTRVEHQPDAEVQFGERRIAIEVELSSKSKKRQPTILYGLARSYSGIWYFCSPSTQVLIQRAIAELSPPALRQKFTVIPLHLEGEPVRRPTVSPTPPPPARQA